MNATLSQLKSFAAFPFAARRFAAQPPPSVAQARAIVQARLQQREANFLAWVEQSVYGWPRSPYLALLRWAGCELGDLRALVADKGLEGALRDLRTAGVYVAFEEFKGRKPLVRPGLTLRVGPADFDNPLASREFAGQTGGSSGDGVPVATGLETVTAAAAHRPLMCAAHGLLHAPTAVWVPLMPGGGMQMSLVHLGAGLPLERWFSPLGWRDSSYWFKYAAATLYLLAWLRLVGVPLPRPRIVRHTQALEVARWLHASAARAGRSLLYTSASQGLRASLAAVEAGLDLSGVTIRVGGEPVTPGKAQAVRRSGAVPLPGFGSVETGSMGLGCAQPVAEDDVHLLTDAFAVFTHPHAVSHAAAVPALNITTLLASARKLMLNYQSDDYGTLEERVCGCPLEDYGYNTHLRQIRSYNKLTGEAVTLIGNDLLRVLDEMLPARFGGSPLDYQLAEEEDEQGFTRLSLLIHPRLDIPDEGAVIDYLQAALGQVSPSADAARAMWQGAQAIQVRRAEPALTARGKLSPLYLERNTPSDRAISPEG